MARYIAFLRAINVGGHVVKMERLRALFGALGLSAVETFIASGNVIFSSGAKDVAALERKIERRLEAELGYAVTTFIRSDAELRAIAEYEAFAPTLLERARTLNIFFLKERLDTAATRKLMALRTDVDDFHAHGREFHWLCRVGQADSTLNNVALQKALGVEMTARGATTVRRLVERYPPARDRP
jgi:uncharacterized protein (DUF1697 family)